MCEPNVIAIHSIVIKTFTQNHKSQPHGGARGTIKGSPKSLSKETFHNNKRLV